MKDIDSFVTRSDHAILRIVRILPAFSPVELTGLAYFLEDRAAEKSTRRAARGGARNTTNRDTAARPCPRH